MNRFLKFVIGLGSFVSVLVITGHLSRSHQDEIANFNTLNVCAHIGVLVGAIFFLEFAIERFLFPVDVLTKPRRKALMEAAEPRSGTFLYGTRGAGCFFLFLYALDLLLGRLHPFPSGVADTPNWLGWSILFLLLALMGRTRSAILQLLNPQKPNQSSIETQQEVTAVSP